MEASRIQIEVRTLTGEATTVSASATDAVSDLKVLLKLSFPPATTSPNFHLFFKGENLRLQSQIGTHRIKPGEVLVLVPFVKKVASSHSEKCGQPEPSSSSRFDNRTMSKFADSAWSDLMQDLSYLRDDLGDGTPSVCNVGGFSGGEGSEDCAREVKRKRGFGCDEMILEMLRDCRSKSVHYEEDYRRFVELLELVNCLSDPYSGDSMLWRRKASLRGCGSGMHNGNGNSCLCPEWLKKIMCGSGMHNGNGNSCLCPEWLKKIMKAFAFLNIFSALVQLRQERTTSTLLKQALERLATFGVELGMQDMEHLSVISPKVVRFVESKEDTSSGNALVTIECSAEPNHGGQNTYKSAQLRIFHSSLLKWCSMDYGALRFAKHASFVNLFFAIRAKFFRRQHPIWQTLYVLIVAVTLLRIGEE